MIQEGARGRGQTGRQCVSAECLPHGFSPVCVMTATDCVCAHLCLCASVCVHQGDTVSERP